MAISLSAITGAAITGLTSPTYTPTVDVPPNPYSKQWAITAIGGTQTGVDTGSSGSRPWTFTAYRPANVRTLNAVDSNNVLRQVPMNEYGILLRKGLTPLAGQASKTALFRATFSVPAGADIADQPNIKAAMSSFVGVLTQQAQGITDTLTTAVL